MSNIRSDIYIEPDRINRFLQLTNTIQTIFTNMSKDNDFIMAFFPCTYFTEQQEVNFRLQMGGIQKDIQKERLAHRRLPVEISLALNAGFDAKHNKEKATYIVDNSSTLDALYNKLQKIIG